MPNLMGYAACNGLIATNKRQETAETAHIIMKQIPVTVRFIVTLSF
jgi:hypothetical protein